MLCPSGGMVDQFGGFRFLNHVYAHGVNHCEESILMLTYLANRGDQGFVEPFFAWLAAPKHGQRVFLDEGRQFLGRGPARHPPLRIGNQPFTPG